MGWCAFVRINQQKSFYLQNEQKPHVPRMINLSSHIRATHAAYIKGLIRENYSSAWRQWAHLQDLTERKYHISLISYSDALNKWRSSRCSDIMTAKKEKPFDVFDHWKSTRVNCCSFIPNDFKDSSQGRKITNYSFTFSEENLLFVNAIGQNSFA